MLVEPRSTVVITARVAKRQRLCFHRCVSLQLRGWVGNTKGLPPPPPPGHNTSLPGQHLPPPWPTHPSPDNTSLPIGNTSLPPARIKGHNTSLPWTTPPSPLEQHLPPGLCAGGQYASYWNAFLFCDWHCSRGWDRLGFYVNEQ